MMECSRREAIVMAFISSFEIVLVDLMDSSLHFAMMRVELRLLKI